MVPARDRERKRERRVAWKRGEGRRRARRKARREREKDFCWRMRLAMVSGDGVLVVAVLLDEMKDGNVRMRGGDFGIGEIVACCM